MNLSHSDIERYAVDPCVAPSQAAMQKLAQIIIEERASLYHLIHRNRELRAEIKEADVVRSMALQQRDAAQRTVDALKRSSDRQPDAIASWRQALDDARNACKRMREERDAALVERDAARKKRRPFFQICFGGSHWHSDQPHL